MEILADYLVKAVKISLRIQEKAGKKLTDFTAALESDEELAGLGKEVSAWARKFSIPGV